MSKDDEQGRVHMVDGILDAAETDGIGNIAGSPDDEEISEAMIENEFGSDAAVRAREHDDVWLLSRGEFAAKRNHIVDVRFSGDEAIVAGEKIGPEFVSGGLVGGGCVMMRGCRDRLLCEAQVG
jgi:hypothetical protein